MFPDSSAPDSSPARNTILSRVAALLSLTLLLLAGCAPKASKESLVGYWSIDEKSVEAMVAAIDPKADEMGAQMARMFFKMAARGIALEFTGAELRQIQNGTPTPPQPYSVSSVEGDRITIQIGKETFTYVFTAGNEMETTLPGGKLAFRLKKMDASAIEALKKKMELAANGPAADSPAAERFNWLLSAPDEKVGPYLAKHPDLVLWKNESGETLLHRAAKARKPTLATLLLERGADKTAADAEGCTPFHRSIEFTFAPQLSKLLYIAAIDLNVPFRGKNTPLAYALRKPDMQKAEFLLELGADPDEGKAAGQKTLFLLAVEKGELAPARLLLKHGADLQHRVSKDEESALHVAARYGSLEMITFLLEQGMPATITNKKKDTPISAVRFRNEEKIEAVRLFVKAGADINAVTHFGGDTLLSGAIERADGDFAKALLEEGADFDGKLVRGGSAYKIAKDHNNTELIALMDARRAAASP